MFSFFGRGRRVVRRHQDGIDGANMALALGTASMRT